MFKFLYLFALIKTTSYPEKADQLFYEIFLR